MKREYKILIDRYLSGTTTGDDLVLINRLLIEDEAFSKRFELKKALHEVQALEDEFLFGKELDALLAGSEKSRRLGIRRKQIIRLVSGIAASVILISGLFFLLNKNNTQELRMNVGYFEVNYDGGTGFLGNPDKSRPVFKRDIHLLFIANKNQADTTYQITNTDSLKITLPKITDELKKTKISSLYDYNLEASLLIINKDTFEIKRSREVEKLLKYKR